MKITDILNEKVIVTNLPGSNKSEIINSMIELAATSDRVLDKEKMRSNSRT